MCKMKVGEEGVFFKSFLLLFMLKSIDNRMVMPDVGGGGLAVMEDKTHFKKCLFLYAESFAVQGDMIVSEGEM